MKVRETDHSIATQPFSPSSLPSSSSSNVARHQSWHRFEKPNIVAALLKSNLNLKKTAKNEVISIIRGRIWWLTSLQSPTSTVRTVLSVMMTRRAVRWWTGATVAARTSRLSAARTASTAVPEATLATRRNNSASTTLTSCQCFGGYLHVALQHRHSPSVRLAATFSPK